MKSIGPYVAARELPSGPEHGAIRTLRATDRLTGMPALLHVLPHPLSLPELPEHPQLLPIVDGGMDGPDAYVVTELPMQAAPARDTVLAARGALTALAALHAHGLTHGGVSGAQLWEVDGQVALAGAGLPWRDTPTPGGDLRDLAHALDAIGILPPALSPLRDAPDDMDAGAALNLLNAPAAGPRPAETPGVRQAPRNKDGAPTEGHQTEPPVIQTAATRAVPVVTASAAVATPEPSASPAPTSPNPPPPSLAAPQPVQAPAETPDPQDAPHDGTPIVLGGGDETAAQAGQTDPAPSQTAPQHLAGTAATPKSRKSKSVLQRGTAKPPAETPAPGAAPTRPELAPSTAPVAPDREVPGPPLSHEAMPATAPVSPPIPVPAVLPSSPLPDDRDPAPAESLQPTAGLTPATEGSAPVGTPVPAFSTAPAGTLETPQERRRRQNEERRAQAMLDAQTAAARKAERLRAEAKDRPSAPIQIGTGPAGTGRPVVIGDDDLPDWTPPDDQPQEAADAPPRPTLRMRNVERLPESLRRPPEPEPEPEPVRIGRLPSRRMAGDSIRIGWDEDDSWRVVKTVETPPVRERRAPRWLLPLLGVLVLVGLVAALAPRLNTGGTPAAVCCDVTFTLRGAAGATARLTLVQAPAGAKLTPGQVLGRAPGPLHLPVAGTYRLKVVADGYTPGELSVTVPRSLPVSIDLGP